MAGSNVAEIDGVVQDLKKVLELCFISAQLKTVSEYEKDSIPHTRIFFSTEPITDKLGLKKVLQTRKYKFFAVKSWDIETSGVSVVVIPKKVPAWLT